MSQEFGGISRYHNELANQLIKSEEVRILAPFYRNKYLNNENAITCYRAPVFKGSYRLFSLVNFFLTQKYLSKNKIDIFHETYYATFKIKGNFKKIITVHDFIHEKFSDFFPDAQVQIERKKNAIMSADHIICISNNTKKDLLDMYNIKQDKVSVVYHGVNDFGVGDNSFEIKMKRPFVLYVGERKFYKNFKNLLLAFNKYKLYETHDLMCFGGGSFSKTEMDIIHRLNLSAFVIHFSGDDQVLSFLYKNADCFVYPSLYEGFGMPVLEAMKFNCPVVASSTSSIPEIAENAILYFDPYEFEDIGLKIKNIISNKKLRDSYIELGKNQVAKFSWQKCALETSKVYSISLGR